MNVQSNTYTFIYSAVMVIIVALALSLTATTLKPRQQLNMEMEKKQAMLASIGVKCTREEAVDLFDKYFKKSYVINSKGEILQGEDAFHINLKNENSKPEDQRKLPLFEAEKDGRKIYVIPVRGKGLWGPIWGYIALEDDFNTIYGVIFDHKSETPGLGAKITTDWFQKQFKGKKLFDDNGNFVSITVVKGGRADMSNPHQVNGISGATLTSKGLQKMLYESLKLYVNYFKQHKNS